jgi:ABC-type lipoprotein release transport system permease subunit
MQKKINEIDNTWYEIQVGLQIADFLGARVGLQIADFLGASQRIRKMILQLKMLKLDVGILMGTPYPELTASLGEKGKENLNK